MVVSKYVEKVNIREISLSIKTAERYLIATEELGWAKSQFTKNVVHAYFSKHHDFYVQAAEKEASARGVSVPELEKAFRRPRTVNQEAIGIHEPDPLSGVEISKDLVFLMAPFYPSIANSVLFHFSCSVGARRMATTLALILTQHLDYYWPTYQRQVDANYRGALEAPKDPGGWRP